MPPTLAPPVVVGSAAISPAAAPAVANKDVWAALEGTSVGAPPESAAGEGGTTAAAPPANVWAALELAEVEADGEAAAGSGTEAGKQIPKPKPKPKAKAKKGGQNSKACVLL